MAKSITFYNNLKSNLEAVRLRSTGLWSLIAQILGTGETYGDELGELRYDESQTLDRMAYDPMCKRAIDTISDYYASLVFPTNNPFAIVPSVPDKDVRQSDMDWFEEQSNKIIKALYSDKSGFLEVRSLFYRDWDTFGTSAFFTTESADDDCPFVVQQFGVDAMAIQDGKNNAPEYAVLTFNWFPQVIVDYFGGEDSKLYGLLPADVRDDYTKGEWKQRHKLFCIIHKNTEYSPDAKMGERTAKYEGVWVFDGEDKIFARNTYFENPLAVARYARVRGEVYGRSDVSNFINTIAAINGILYLAYQAAGKMADPAIGVYDNALAQDTEVDTDAGAIIALDSTFASGANPIVPIQDIGDIAPITDFLLKYLSEELVKAFKLDIIVPIVQTGTMTATEFVNRLALQSEVLSGVLMRHLAQIDGFYKRVVNICARREGFLDMANAPQFVKDAIKNGKPWYDVKFNNSIVNIINSSKQRDFVNTCNSLLMAAQLDQSILADIDMYDSVLEIVKDSVLQNVLPTKQEHNQRKAQREIMAIQAQQAQVANIASQANRNNAQANKEQV
jgi:hypothetical protein